MPFSKRRALVNMLPSKAAHNAKNRLDADGIFARQLTHAAAVGMCAPDCSHHIRVELSSPYALAPHNLIRMQAGTMAHPSSRTALSGRIPVIVALCAKKQVIGSDTLSHITPVQHAQALRNRAKVQLIGKAMRRDRLTVNTQLSIPPVAGLPQPAALRVGALVNVRPERLNRGLLRLVADAEPSRLPFDLAQGLVGTGVEPCALSTAALTKPVSRTPWCVPGTVASEPSLVRIRGHATTALTQVRSVGCGLIRFWYTSHVASLLNRLVAIPRLLRAARGSLVPIVAQGGA
jgi:hypothetical protein